MLDGRNQGSNFRSRAALTLDMKKPQKHKKRSPGDGTALSEEDRRLWDHLARSVDAFPGRANRVLPTFDEHRFQPHGTPPTLHGGEPAVGSKRQAPSTRPAVPARPSGAALHRSPSLSDFDQRSARKIRAGRIEIESRLDLHGMRQHQAYGALRAFLFRAQSRGLRWVMVITGKGEFARGQEGRYGAADWMMGPPRGVLRRNVPMWLSEPELRSVVVSYTTAAVHHGGDGALYVQLRSRKR